MNLKDILGDVVQRGEKIKDELVDELSRSKALNQLVSNKSFVGAISRVIETKDEVQRVLQKQIHNLFQIMDLPTRNEMGRMGEKLRDLEKYLTGTSGRTASKGRKTGAAKRTTRAAVKRAKTGAGSAAKTAKPASRKTGKARSHAGR